MSKQIHKGTELNNVGETWQRNEQQSSGGGTPSTSSESLDRRIKKEADEYERANKEERLLGGERATENDGEGTSGT